MRVAVVGSRDIVVNDLEIYLPFAISEIVSGGAKGVDTSARRYAIENDIKLKEFIPDYKRFGRIAPLKRKIEIIKYSDIVDAFWDGISRGIRYVIDKCIELNKIVYQYDWEQQIFRKLKIY